MNLYNIVDFRNLEPGGKMTERTRLFTGYGCNIKCKFCFYKDSKHIDIKDKIYQQLEQGKRFGIRDWDISGGEPSILPYWFEILDEMKEMGFRNIACITNGYKFANADFLKQSKEKGLNEILFSLHGSNEQIHDNMTGVKDSFNNLATAIDNAKCYAMKIRINAVVTKDNYKNLPRIAEYANQIRPVAFNFLPFRMENSASKDNMVRYSGIVPYIKEAVGILDDSIKVSVRYVPFCLFKGYEKHVAGYLQRAFDEYEWNEYTIRNFDIVRFNKDVPELNCEADKWKLEINAIHGSIKHVANHALTCLPCKYLKVCDGIWRSYAKVWGIEEFKAVHGEKTTCI
jgi:MoaA/NifB/PqqE/SkfB family radical SAM enzyme